MTDKMGKLSASQIIYKALVWAEEGMEQMVDADPHGYGIIVSDELKQLRAYRYRRFGKPKDPLEGAKKVSAWDTKFTND